MCVDIEDMGIKWGSAVVCVAHGWSFDLDTGACGNNRYVIDTYKVQVDDGKPNRNILSATRSGNMHWVHGVEVYVRRPPSEGEDPQEFLLDHGDDSLNLDSGALSSNDEHLYRLISRSHPLELDVHEGGSLHIYLVLVEDTDPVPPSDSPTIGVTSLPFAIYHTPSPFPITFQSPSSEISYRMVFRFYTKHKSAGSDVFTHIIPVNVIPAWSGAPPPALPALGEGDNGVRVVVDVDGSVQGSVKMFGTGHHHHHHHHSHHNYHHHSHHSNSPLSSHNDSHSALATIKGNNSSESDDDSESDEGEDSMLWLRPRILHDGSQIRSSRLIPDTEVPGSPLFSSANASVMSERENNFPLSFATPLVSQSGTDLRRSSSLTGVDTLLNKMGISNSRRNDSTGNLRRNVSFAMGKASGIVPIVLEERDKNLPLPYTIEDPLAGHISSQPSGLHFRQLSLASLQSVDSSPVYARNDESQSGHVSDEAPAYQDIGSPAEAFQTSSSAPPLPPLLELDLAMQASHSKVPKSLKGKLSFILPKSKSADFEVLPRSTANVTSSPSLLARPSSRNGLHSQRFTLLPAPVVDDAQKPYSFNFLLPSTIIGPNSHIPITISFADNEYQPEFASYIEVSLVADVKCDAMGKVKHDIMQLASIKVNVDSHNLEKKVVLTVPSSKELGYFATGMVAPLIEVTHKMIFQLHTHQQRAFGIGWKEVNLELGQNHLDTESFHRTKTMAEYVKVYVRRALATGELPGQYSLDRGGSDADSSNDNDSSDTENDLDSHGRPRPLEQLPYRLVSNSSHPLGMVKFRLQQKPAIEKLSIEISVVGQVHTRWIDNLHLVYSHRNTFLRTKDYLVQESDPVPEPNCPNRFIELPFAVYRSPSPFPISFKSPSSTIEYFLTIKFRLKSSTGTTIVDHVVPAIVVPPWSGAPPPEIPSLGPNDNGVRVIVDVDGGVQGSVRMFGASSPLLSVHIHESEAATSDTMSIYQHHEIHHYQPPQRERDFDEDSLWLRPRVLHGGLSSRPSGLSIRAGIAGGGGGSFITRTESRLGGGGGGGASFLGRTESPAYSERDSESIQARSIQQRSGSRIGSMLNSFSGFSTSVTSNDRPLGTRSKTELNFSQMKIQRFLRKNMSAVSAEAMVVPLVVEQNDPSLPLPYTSEDPLAGQHEFDRGSIEQTPLPRFIPHSSPIYSPPSIVLSPDSDSNIGVNGTDGLGIGDIASNNISNNTNMIPTTITTIVEDPPADASSMMLKSRILFDPRQLLKRLMSAKASDPERRAQTPPVSQQQQPEIFPEDLNVSIAVTTARPATALNISKLKTRASFKNTPRPDPYEFNFLLASTIIGPNSQIPITITFIDQDYDSKRETYIEVSLIADVACTAMGKVKHDLIPLGSMKAEIDCREFEKQIWFKVPSSDELRCFAVGFKAPLVELSHRMEFRLFSQRQRAFGIGQKEYTIELGSVAVTMLR
ncbi:hypothetical protein HK100_011795, partial [Physocladia obscura]